LQFTVQNRTAADFATLAADSNVQVLAEDFNGDGRTDLALVNSALGWKTVPEGLSDPVGFATENLSAPDFATLAADPDVEALAGDFNGDGKADLALINLEFAPNYSDSRRCLASLNTTNPTCPTCCCRS
jgi:hypothetical protein